VRAAVPELFWGNKERRRDSVFRQYNGDYLKAKNSRMHKAIKKKYGMCTPPPRKHLTAPCRSITMVPRAGERRLFFSDKTVFVEKGKLKQRALLMTEGAFYTVGGKWRKKIQRRIPLQDIASVELRCESPLLLVRVPRRVVVVARVP
jgi:hypothetical protein